MQLVRRSQDSKPHVVHGTVLSKQITTGFHTTDVWRSVLFQLVSALAVLQEKYTKEEIVFFFDKETKLQKVKTTIFPVSKKMYDCLKQLEKEWKKEK